jgi:hypothetical protein
MRPSERPAASAGASGSADDIARPPKTKCEQAEPTVSGDAAGGGGDAEHPADQGLAPVALQRLHAG